MVEKWDGRLDAAGVVVVGIWDDSFPELNLSIDSRVIERLLELTIDDSGVTISASRCSHSRSQLTLDMVGLSFEGGRGMDLGVMSRKIRELLR